MQKASLGLDFPQVLTPKSLSLLIFYALNFKHQRGTQAARQGGFGHYILSHSFFPSSPSRQDYGLHLLILVWKQQSNIFFFFVELYNCFLPLLQWKRLEAILFAQTEPG